MDNIPKDSHCDRESDHGASSFALSLRQIDKAKDTADTRAENTEHPVDGLHLIRGAWAALWTSVLLPESTIKELAAVLTLLGDRLDVLAAERALFFTIVPDRAAHRSAFVFGFICQFVRIRDFDHLLTIWTFSALPRVCARYGADCFTMWT